MAVTTAGNGTAIATPSSDREMTFVPFGSKDSIKLSAKIVQSMVCVPTKSGKVCSEIEAMKFMMLCKARALNPFEGDAFLIGYDSNNGPTFSLITAHQAFLKRAEIHTEYDGMESGLVVTDKSGTMLDREGDFFLEGDTILGAWATVFFKTRSHPMRKRIRLQAFVKPYGRWKDDPAGMIVKCVEADALRSSFPTTLGGLYIDGEAPLQFVNDPPAPAPEIPKRRSKLKDLQPSQTSEQENLDTAGGEVPNDPTFDEDAANQWAMNLNDAMQEATTMDGMYKVGADIKERRKVLGEKAYGELMGVYQAKCTDLLAANAKGK